MRKRTMTLIAVPLAALAIACGSGGSTDKSSGSSGGGDKKTAGAAAAGAIGKPVRDGKFEFTVQKVKCGVAKIGSDLLNERAQGQFCLVTLKVSNIGKEAQTFSDSNQKAFGADGSQFSADTAAGLYANNNADAFLNDINPGNSVTGTIVFDIPKNAKIAKLELHDSAFSGGVDITVK